MTVPSLRPSSVSSSSCSPSSPRVVSPRWSRPSRRSIIHVVPLKPERRPDHANRESGSRTVVESCADGRCDLARRSVRLLLIIGWVLMNVDNLIVGVFAFMHSALPSSYWRRSAVFVADERVEGRAVKAGLRGEKVGCGRVLRPRPPCSSGQCLGFAYFKTFASESCALRAHHVGHLAREAVIAVSGDEQDGVSDPAAERGEPSRQEFFGTPAPSSVRTSPIRRDFGVMSVSDLCEVAGEADGGFGDTQSAYGSSDGPPRARWR